jgi:dTDP-4-dehydrorhamnose 3,5-epimerase
MTVPFIFKRLEIPDVVLIQPRVFEDARGFFMETYQQREFEKFGIAQPFIQDNHSRSKKGVLRGLHYQKDPMAQGKLVRCTRGAVFDVAVDLRRGSPTYGQWVGRVLSEESKLILWIPRGFAHGYTALEDNTEVFYKTDNLYSVHHERGIIWSDPEIGIQWPMVSPIVSDKDATFPKFREADHNFVYGVK